MCRRHYFHYLCHGGSGPDSRVGHHDVRGQNPSWMHYTRTVAWMPAGEALLTWMKGAGALWYS